MIKYKTVLLALVSAVLIASCNIKEEQFFQDELQTVLTATLEGNGALKGIADNSNGAAEESKLSTAEEKLDTRTTVQDGGTQIYWEPADEINVFFDGKVSKFVSRNTGNAEIADFYGSMDITGASSQNPIWGLSPYSLFASSDKKSVKTSIPVIQFGRAGSFDKKSHVMVACSVGSELVFYNVCGGLRFSLTQEGIKRITFEGNNGEALAGGIIISFAGGLPVISLSGHAQKISIYAPDGSTFKTGKWYYIEAVPCDLTKGFTMVFYKEKEYATLESSTPVSFKRGVYGSFTEADKGLTFKDRYLAAEAVDLGLSVLWGSWNLFESVDHEELGYSFAWGEVEPKSFYAWSNYKWCNGSNNLTKYNTDPSYGTVDNKTVLDPEDDAATVYWGDDWHIPTVAEWRELVDNCTWTWVKNYNGTSASGYIVTSNVPDYKGKSIFLPTSVQYWSSSILEEAPIYAYSYEHLYSIFARVKESRELGHCIRPVKCKKPAEAVDLKLSVKWASYNLGATNPYEYGRYFAWGDINSHLLGNQYVFDWGNYKWGGPYTFTKYNTNKNYGTVDNKTVLDPEDDAATVYWGGSWRIPTADEWRELKNKCIWTWTDNYNETGVSGYIVTRGNGSIFLPAAGTWGDYHSDHRRVRVGSHGFYWSSSLNTDEPNEAWYVWFHSQEVRFSEDERYRGNSIRPVLE